MQTSDVRTRGSSKTLLLVALLGSGACDAGQVDGEEAADDATPDVITAVANDNSVVVDWSQIAYDTATVDVYFSPRLFHHDRAFTMMHLAQHDALNAIKPRYRQYAYTGRDRRANPVAAVAQASHDVLLAVYPAQAATLDAALADYLATIPNGNAKTRGVALGQASADAILTLRADDGIDEWGEYTPGTEPGDYQYTPGNDFAFKPALAQVPPFSLDSGDQFRSPPPPSLTSRGYARDYNEVKSVGRIDSTTRTADQTSYASYWYELSDASWNRLGRETAVDRDLGLWETARMMALLNMTMLDGYIAGWDSKLFYDLWRPITAIRAGDTDGNDATIADPAWDSLLAAPPIMDYPSTHSVLGAGAATVLAATYGRDRGTFSFTSFSGLPGEETRTFSSFSAAAFENADSRVRAGIHFRFACNAGLLMGARIAAHAIRNHLQPL
jgi:hypothetical protein